MLHWYKRGRDASLGTAERPWHGMAGCGRSRWWGMARRTVKAAAGAAAATHRLGMEHLVTRDGGNQLLHAAEGRHTQQVEVAGAGPRVLRRHQRRRVLAFRARQRPKVEEGEGRAGIFVACRHVMRVAMVTHACQMSL